VIVERLDRLAREYRVQESLLIYLASKGIRLISAATDEDVTQALQADPMKKALIQVQGVFAELEKSLLVKKLKAARERKKRIQGKCEGRKSYREIAPEILREIRRLRRKPKGRRRMSYEKIAIALNERGFVNQNGGQFTGNAVRGIIHRSRK
jgi:DNA invertase Pin-like site-specific DNA recombinase